jgi:Fe-S cluster assembly iron-binding protein IscA
MFILNFLYDIDIIYIFKSLHRSSLNWVMNIQIDIQNLIGSGLEIQNPYILDFDLDINYSFRFGYE